MTKRNNNRQEDEERLKAAPDRVTKTHGGKLVEAVAPEELQSFNDADCKHEKLVKDESETDFNAFICANPSCNEVFIHGKQ